MIGHTLDMRAAHANPKSGKYYGPHNIKEFIDKNIHVYMRDPQEGTKPKWLKDVLRDVLTPLIQAIDPHWAGTEGDWAVQINVINSAEQSMCPSTGTSMVTTLRRSTGWHWGISRAASSPFGATTNARSTRSIFETTSYA
jgi:hypothetical protein